MFILETLTDYVTAVADAIRTVGYTVRSLDRNANRFRTVAWPKRYGQDGMLACPRILHDSF